MRNVGSLMKRYAVQVQELPLWVETLSELLADREENAKRFIDSTYDSVILGKPVGEALWAKANADYEHANAAREDEDGEKEHSSGRAAPLRFDPSLVVRGGILRDEGRRILAEGIPYVWDGIIPGYGMVGFHIAQTKVGKSTLGSSWPVRLAVARSSWAVRCRSGRFSTSR